ncbi:MAG: serine/threonine-protein kinase [Planctomycetota bacterium]|nr:serine/threonine-protein kinase [Planctomycetota bacterium]MDA1163579.1 serine/threonine-protein kinase [Planctomycetota bacterium]
MLKARQNIGKYRIEKRLALGGFAAVYRAYDTIEGIRVALKVPHDEHVTVDALRTFRNEARLVAKLDHPNVLPIKDASIIDDRFVIVTPLGTATLLERWQRRMTMQKRLELVEQMLAGVAHAHDRKIIHCDIKPENFILFSGNRIRLADFGIARFARRTLHGSGSGTVGYMSPDQAMGRPSLRSDVFSLGLLIYRLMTGHLPEWPFEWPLEGHARLRRATSGDFISFLQKSLELNPRGRYADAAEMLSEFELLRETSLQTGKVRTTVRQARGTTRRRRVTPARRKHQRVR